MFQVTERRSSLRAAFLALLLAFGVFAQTDAQVRRSQDAKQLMAAGRFAEAAPIYEELTRALPSNVGLRLNLALAYHMLGRHTDAVPEFERVLKADAKNGPALLSLGAAYLELNQPAKAINPLNAYVALDPEHVPARGMLANALLTLGRSSEALPHFRKLTVLIPNDPKAWYGLGRTYEALAADTFRELDKTAQGSAEWLALVAESRLENRQDRSAFYFYREALSKKSDLRGLHAALALIYRRTGHPDWAVAEEQKEAGLPKPDCAREKAVCAFMTGRFTEAAAADSPLYWRTRAYNELAVQAFRKLGSLPPSIELHLLKAEIHANRDQKREAVTELQAAAKLAPVDVRVTRRLAIAVHDAHDYANAISLIEQLLGAEPRDAELQFLLGDSWLQQSEAEKALEPMRTAVRLDPKLLPARAGLGMTLSRLGHAADAIPHLTAALSIDEDGSLHYQLARAMQSAGQADKAEPIMAKYKELKERSEREAEKLEAAAVITAPEQ